MKILVAGWDSGGGVEAVQTVVLRAGRCRDRAVVALMMGMFRTAVPALNQAATLAAERNEALVVDELERAALEGTAMSHSFPRDPSWR